MTWRDRLQPAKFGTAAFLVDSAEAEIGRNTQVHVYPLRDTPFVEDLGRMPRRIQLSAYVIGAEYMTARDALIAEIERPGPRTLVHPYLGELTASLINCVGPRESTREGGMAWFAMTFVESGQQIFPSATVDTARDVQQKADVASFAAGSSFISTFSTVAAPPSVLASATSLVQGFADKVRSIVQAVTTVPQPLSGFLTALSDLSGAASTLILVPQSLLSTVMSIIQQVEDIVDRPEFALDIVRNLFNFGDDLETPIVETPSGMRAQANQAAFVGLVRQAATIQAGAIVSLIPFTGPVRQTGTIQAATVQAGAIASLIPFTAAAFDDVTALKQELVTQFDALADVAADDDLYRALVEVRTAVTVDLQRRAEPLARLVPLTLQEFMPALALAYDLYEDSMRDAEIIARNGIRHPLFVDSGRTLRVLSDG